MSGGRQSRVPKIPPARQSGESPARSAGSISVIRRAETPSRKSKATSRSRRQSRSPVPSRTSSKSPKPKPQRPLRTGGQSPAKRAGLKPPVSAATPANRSPAPQSRGPKIARHGGQSPASSAGSSPVTRPPGPQPATGSKAATPSPMSTAAPRSPKQSPVSTRINSKSTKPKGHARHSGELLAPIAPLPPHVTAAIAAAIRTHTPEPAVRSIPDTPLSESATQNSVTQQPSRLPQSPFATPQKHRRSPHSKHVARSQ